MINYILEKKDVEVLNRNKITDDHFSTYLEPIRFIKDFYSKNGQSPTMETVWTTFPNVERVELEHLDSVIAGLKEERLRKKVEPILVQAAELVSERKTEDAVHIVKMQAERILKEIGSSGKGYRYVERAEERKQKYLDIHGKFKDGVRGYTTGFKPLDLATSGLVAGGEETDYFLVFAPSNMGKTLISSFLLQAAWSSDTPGDYPAYFALEQSALEIARNWDNVLARVSRIALQRGTMTPEMKDKYIQFLDDLRKRNKDMVIYDIQSNGGKPYTVDEIYHILVSEGHTRFALDQLSKVRVCKSFSGYDLRNRLFDTSTQVREMILSTGIPGFIVSQANRDSAKRVKKSLEDSEITGEDIGETYAIYQDASKGISIIKINSNTFKIQVIKNRDNESGQSFLVRYNFDTGIVGVLDDESNAKYF